MEYEFTDETAQKLVKALRNLAHYINEESRPTLRVAQSFNNVDFDYLIDLLIESHNRFYLDISGVDTAGMLLRSVNWNITKGAVEKLIGDLKRVPTSEEPGRKIRIELNQSIFTEANGVHLDLFFDLLEAAHKKASIKFKDKVDISDHF